MNNNKSLRIRFKKTGSMRFISHLDLNRAMARAFRRAGLPIAYSEGFNPRPKLVFGLNLSIGAESCCEILDTQLTYEMPFDQVQSALNGTLPDEINVYEIYEPVMPLKTIAFADYTLSFYCENDITQQIANAFVPPVTVLKHTKSSQALTDISGNIKEISTEYQDGRMLIHAKITSGTGDYLNPEYILKVVAEKAFPSADSSGCRILRTQIYNADMEIFR